MKLIYCVLFCLLVSSVSDAQNENDTSKDRFDVDVGFGIQKMKMEVFNDYLTTYDRIGNLESTYEPINQGYLISISSRYKFLASKKLTTSLKYDFTWSSTLGTYSMYTPSGSQLWYQEKIVFAHILSPGVGYLIINKEKLEIGATVGPSYYWAFIAQNSWINTREENVYTCLPGESWGYFLESNIQYTIWKRISLSLKVGFRQGKVSKMRNFVGTRLVYTSNDYEVTSLGFEYKSKPLELDFSGIYGNFGIGVLIY